MKASKTKEQGQLLAQNLADFLNSDGRSYRPRYNGALLDQLHIAIDELGANPTGHTAPTGFTDWLTFVNTVLSVKLTPADRAKFQQLHKPKAPHRKRINSDSEALAAAQILHGLFSNTADMSGLPNYQTLWQIETATKVLNGRATATPPIGFDSWRDFVCDTLNELPPELRSKTLARLRMQRSRTKRNLVSLEVEAPTMAKLQEWQHKHGHRNLSQAIDDLLGKVGKE